MTISDNGNRDQYIAEAGQTIFPYSYKIFPDDPLNPESSNDLNVYLTPVGRQPSDVDDLLTVITDYTVTNVGVDTGGNIILNVPSNEGDIITIERDIDIDRTTDYGLDPEFTGESFDRSFEKSRAIEQQVRGLIENRGLTYPATTLTSSEDTPNPTRDQRLPLLKANQLWKMNDARTAIVPADTVEPVSCSSLRSELADQTPGSDGARLVGFDSDINGGTTVRDELTFLDPPIPDNIFHFKNIFDDTKKLRLDLSNLDTNRQIIGNMPIVDFMAGYPPYYFKGFELLYSLDSPSVKLRINAGCARKGYSKYVFVLQSDIVKNISLPWEEGYDKGGLASSLTLTVDTWYHVFIIVKNNGFIDAGFDTNINATNLLSDASDYSDFLRIGSVLTTGVPDITKFIQDENLFLFDLPRLDVDDNNPGTSAIISILSTPINVKVDAFISCDFLDGVSERTAYISSLSVADVPPSRIGAFTVICGQTNEDQVQLRVLTDTNSSIRYRLDSSAATTTIRMNILGWYDKFNIV